MAEPTKCIIFMDFYSLFKGVWIMSALLLPHSMYDLALCSAQTSSRTLHVAPSDLSDLFWIAVLNLACPTNLPSPRALVLARLSCSYQRRIMACKRFSNSTDTERKRQKTLAPVMEVLFRPPKLTRRTTMPSVRTSLCRRQTRRPHLRLLRRS